MRFVAACLVVFFHTTQAVSQYFGGGISPSVLYASELGAAGVHIFFVISGFIMVYTSFSGPGGTFSARAFFLRRFIRIYPIYWFYCVLYISFHQFFGQAYSASVKDFVLSLLLVPGYSPFIIGPGWTLSYEVYFYICFAAAIGLGLGLARGLSLLAGFFLLSVALRPVFSSSDPILQVVTDSLLIEFLLGALIGYLVVSRAKIGDRLSMAMLILAGVGFVAGYLIGFRRFPTLLIWGMPSALLLAGLVFHERTAGVPSWIKKFAFLGDSSYSLYLLHILLIDVFIASYKMMFGELNSGSMSVIVGLTMFCVIVSFASYELVERNLITSIQLVLKRRRSQTCSAE